MTPLFHGHYVSEVIHKEEWHAGVKMTEDYFRFLKFFPDGYWLWCDYGNTKLDFPAFVANFDLEKWRRNHMHISPPVSDERDGGYLFQFGTHRMDGDKVILTFHSRIVSFTPKSELSVLNEGKSLSGFNSRFTFHPCSASAQST